jgi:F-type H+-transporting ATPase subunit b
MGNAHPAAGQMECYRCKHFVVALTVFYGEASPMAQGNAKQIESIEHPSGNESIKFPPFDKQSFPSQLVWLVLSFVALYLLMSRIALPRIGSLLEARNKQVEAELNEANRLKVESDEMNAAYQQALADARGRAQALAKEAHEQAAAQAEELRKKMNAEHNARIAEAEKAIAARQSTAMANVESIVTEITSAIVGKLTGVTPANNDVADAVKKTLKR